MEMYIYIYIYMYTHTHTHTHTGPLLSHKNEILPFAATWMDLENIILTKVSQTGRQIFYAITSMQNVKNNTNQYIYKKLTDSQTQKTNLWLQKGNGKGGAYIRNMRLTGRNFTA